MTRWLTIVLVLCWTVLSPSSLLLAQGKKGKKGPKNPSPVAGEKEDESRVVFAFDPGSHTRPISALGFNKDQSKLITVGWDYTIQIWSTKTGERLDIIRLPAYGRDNGFDSNRWNLAAISADGGIVAVGGGPKLLFGDKGVPTRLLIVDVVNRRVRKLNFPVDAKSPVTCLSLSARGDRLAVGFGGVDKSVYVLDDVIELMKNAPLNAPPTARPVVQDAKNDPLIVSLSASGNKLLIGESRDIATWNITGKSPEAWKKLGEVKDDVRTDLLEWAPDESHFARSWNQAVGRDNRGIELRSPEGQLKEKWAYGDLTPGFGNQAIGSTFRYLAADRLFISAHGGIGQGEGFGALGVILDPQTGKTVRRFSATSTGMYTPVGAASATGMLAATSTDKGLGAVIYSLIDGKVVARCGSRTPVPTIVGWSKEAQSPAIAWSDDGELTPQKSKLEDLKYAFDLATMEPVSKVEPIRFDVRRLNHGEWKLTTSGAGNFHQVRLQQGEKEVAKLFGGLAITLVPNGKDRPLFARSAHDGVTDMGSYAYLQDGTGKHLADLLPVATHVRDMVSSPDGRYLLISTGTHRLSIYRTDGSNFPFLNLVQANGEWVAWSPAGYFAASPGGERMIGWSESKGSSEFPVFHAADKFAKDYRRPDVLKLAMEKGSLSEAIEALDAETRAVEEILPPQGELKILKQDGGRIQVQATAVARAKDQPVVALRLLLDGRPLAGGVGLKNIETGGEQAEAVWEVDIPAGSHVLKLLARSEGSSAESEPLIVVGAKTAEQQRVLHRLCVGVDQYALPALNLTTAARDATDVFGALEKYCVGPNNRFETTRGVLLTDQQATRLAVGNAIRDIRKTAKPGDLIVVFYAGHGIKQHDEYYLLTHEGDPSESLKGKSVSGTDLRQVLQDTECPVLLMMDSCRSALGVKSFRPATDDLTRDLTEDSVGVTVLAAAMAHEDASDNEVNGHFTAAFLKALKVGQNVPFDHNEHLLYTTHIYDVVYSEVRKATNGKQTPIHRPGNVLPLPIRQVPHD